MAGSCSRDLRGATTEKKRVHETLGHMKHLTSTKRCRAEVWWVRVSALRHGPGNERSLIRRERFIRLKLKLTRRSTSEPRPRQMLPAAPSRQHVGAGGGIRTHALRVLILGSLNAKPMLK